MRHRGSRVLSVCAAAVALLGSTAATAHAHPGALPRDTAQTGCTAARFHPLTPVREYDRRAFPAGTPVAAPLPDVPAGACAVVATVTGAAATTGTYVTAWSGGTRPATSNLNVQRGRDSADLVTVGLAPSLAAPTLDLFSAAGSLRVIVDVDGYYSDDATIAPDVFTPLAPVRVLDSTHGTGPAPTADGTGSTVTLTRAQLHVPAGAAAVAVNLAAVAGAAGTYVAAYPAGTTPSTSALNVAPREARAALAVVPLGSGGLTLHNAVGGPSAVRLIADVQGWYSTTATGALFASTAPARTSYALGPNATADDTPLPDAAAVDAVFTLTAKGATAAAAEQAYPAPAGSAVPTVSAVNVVAGVDTPNLVMSPLSSQGVLRLRNQTNAGASVTDLVDLVGYFVAVPPGNDVSYAQCNPTGDTSRTSTTLPADATFGVINPEQTALAFSGGTSPCLAAEDAWAAGTGDEQWYAALSDKGPSSANWPGGSCAGANTAACAYQFGSDQAADVYAQASATGHQQGRWWLDVESSAPWQSSTSQNAQVVAGALAYLQGQGVTVGLYSQPSQWTPLVGSLTYPSLDEWVGDGQRSVAALAGDCTTPFAGGPVALVQSAGPDAPGQANTALDYDFRC